MQITELVVSWGYSVTVRGIPVYISAWTLVLAFLLYWEAKMYITRQLSDLRHVLRCSRLALVAGAAIGAVLLLASVAAHELGHALMARQFGYHITGAGVSWWGAYVSLPEGYEKGSPWAMIAISFAGPATNIAISFVLAFFVWLMQESATENTLQFVAYMNYRLGKLNFLPLIVLDGGKMLWGVARLISGDSDIAYAAEMTVSAIMIVYLLMRQKRTRREQSEPTDAYERWLEQA